jgi:hypothetical protein
VVKWILKVASYGIAIKATAVVKPILSACAITHPWIVVPTSMVFIGAFVYKYGLHNDTFCLGLVLGLTASGGPAVIIPCETFSSLSLFIRERVVRLHSILPRKL